MSVHLTSNGTWQVRWREGGRQLSKTFKRKTDADEFDQMVLNRQSRGLTAELEPLWRSVLRGQLGEAAALEVDSVNPNGHFVYILWGTSDDKPLYVGRSSNVLARLGNHMVNPQRRQCIARVSLVRCLDRTTATQVEAQLIDFYQCELNKLDGMGHRVDWQSSERVESGDADQGVLVSDLG
jgi:hypothetical protein